MTRSLQLIICLTNEGSMMTLEVITLNRNRQKYAVTYNLLIVFVACTDHIQEISEMPLV